MEYFLSKNTKPKIFNVKPKKMESFTPLSKDTFIKARIKAFITDMFLINMPILYITTYLVLGGKDEFLQSQMAHMVAEGLYMWICILFFYFSAQTPGFRYAQIAIISSSGEKASFLQAILFELLAIVGILGFVFAPKKPTLNERLARVRVVYKKNPNIKY